MSDSLPLDEVPEINTNENLNRRSVPKHWIVLGLFGFRPCGIWCDILILWEKLLGRVRMWVHTCMMGFLFSQPILFAIWAAFAPQRFYQRFLWCLLFCTLVSFVVELGAITAMRSNGSWAEYAVRYTTFYSSNNHFVVGSTIFPTGKLYILVK